jgi:hypothetical protein
MACSLSAPDQPDWCSPTGWHGWLSNSASLSQLMINYRDSRLSKGKAGEIHGGDRLPWVKTADNYGLADRTFVAGARLRQREPGTDSLVQGA